GRGVQPVDRLHRDVHGRVEAERVVGGAQVVVDRLGYPDDPHVQVGQLGGHAEGVLAADGDQRVHPELDEVGLDPLNTTVDLERVGPRGAEDRAAARQDAAHLGDAERAGDPLQRASPAVAEPDELVPVRRHALADHGADDRVETGAVATTGQHADAHT